MMGPFSSAYCLAYAVTCFTASTSMPSAWEVAYIRTSYNSVSAVVYYHWIRAVRLRDVHLFDSVIQSNQSFFSIISMLSTWDSCIETHRSHLFEHNQQPASHLCHKPKCQLITEVTIISSQIAASWIRTVSTQHFAHVISMYASSFSTLMLLCARKILTVAA